MKSFFTDRQWQWVFDRYQEGYTLVDLASFLGVHRHSVRRGLKRIGKKPGIREELPPLAARRREFLALYRTPEEVKGSERSHAI